jgi:hypothetical protein
VARRGGDAAPATAPRLFGAGEMRLRRTGEARLKDLARLPARPPTLREARDDEDRGTIETLRTRGRILADRFGLAWKSLEAERDGVVAHYGVCYADGAIRVRLRHATTGRLLKESSLVDTLCHELAHLKHFDHSPRFKRFYLKILDEARRLGFYRPGPGEDPPERQRSLFADDLCGSVPARAAARPGRRQPEE